jgi:putative ABC transport system ATP-binding protein
MKKANDEHQRSSWIVELENVSKVYDATRAKQHSDARVVALSNVSLRVGRGELVAVVGASGSGKSTLLHMMGALDVPTSGVVRIDGQNLAELSDNERTRLRRSRIGFVFQFFNLMPTLTALENAMLPSLLAGAPMKETTARALQQLEAVGLSHRVRHRPEALSGGEMQRVAIARALVSDPPLLLADEPTGNLDSSAGEEVLSLLVGAASARRTVVIVTHDQRLAALGSRVVRTRDGKVVAEEQPTRLYDAAALA